MLDSCDTAAISARLREDTTSFVKGGPPAEVFGRSDLIDFA